MSAGRVDDGQVRLACDAAVRLGGSIIDRFDRERPLDALLHLQPTAAVLVLARVREWLNAQPDVERVISVGWIDQSADYVGGGFDRVVRVVYDDEPQPLAHKLFDLWIRDGMIAAPDEDE